MGRRLALGLRIVAIVVILALGASATDLWERLPSAAPGGLPEGWVALGGCRVVDHDHNDGDSFEVLGPQGERLTARLYFVDTPESRDKRFRDHRQRVREQAAYFGRSDYQRGLALGRRAKAWTLTLLADQPFRVVTRRELVFGGPRVYALIEVRHEGRPRWLHELLVEQGLARIHTRGVDIPRGPRRAEQARRLRALEARARAQRFGGWGDQLPAPVSRR